MVQKVLPSRFRNFIGHLIEPLKNALIINDLSSNEGRNFISASLSRKGGDRGGTDVGPLNRCSVRMMVYP